MTKYINSTFPRDMTPGKKFHPGVVAAHKRLLADPDYKSVEVIIAEEAFKEGKKW